MRVDTTGPIPDLKKIGKSGKYTGGEDTRVKIVGGYCGGVLRGGTRGVTKCEMSPRHTFSGVNFHVESESGLLS